MNEHDARERRELAKDVFTLEAEGAQLMAEENAMLRAALRRTLDWLASYPGGGPMRPGGPYEQARAALGEPCNRERT